MRIIAGHFKGRRLKSPATDAVRPTSDSLRETLFNVLADRVAGARVLDGFAGTGAIGLEALSRGAAHATFVEREPRAMRVIEENVALCGAGDLCTLIRADFTGLAARRSNLASYDVIVLDPPYDHTDFDALVEEGGRLLAPGGWLVLEHRRRRETPATAPGLVRWRVLNAGDSALAFYAAAATK